MNITRTSNSLLARATTLDASYVSRLRRGERRLPKRANYVEAMAAYFARHSLDAYQRKALADIINDDLLTAGEDRIRELLAMWLQDQTVNEKSVQSFLDKLSQYQYKKAAQPALSIRLSYPAGTGDHDQKNETLIYYGIDGKREAVLHFLSHVLLTEGEPQTLLLFSDESMSWINDSPDFRTNWSRMMLQVILKGHRIKIVHTVNRHLDEMLMAIEEWMPLYMTGAVEPYYYPRKRDGIFKRTLFIAPDTCAVISTSVGDMESKAANFYLRGSKAVEAVSQEYMNYFALCRPLMRIYTKREKEDYFRILLDFEKEKADSIMRSGSLSINTIPEELSRHVLDRVNDQDRELIRHYFVQRVQNLKQTLLQSRYTEIISLPDIAAIKSGRVKFVLSDLLEVEGVYYRPEEYRLHLENIVKLLQSHENYHVCIDESFMEDSYLLYVREDIGVIVAKTSHPSLIIAFDESNMAAAFWDFLNRKLDHLSEDSLRREKTISRLQAIIDELRIED
ncbi:transcriptional regulator [Dehalobacter sp. DCM]|uniref:transcriptional regulator n=1 Tax=Dehalobacter sp. DCM TaxID=2907827 RepID=UPI0030821CDD|nr:transcriptional regulator [Dehalobacter sp. DCM]